MNLASQVSHTLDDPAALAINVVTSYLTRVLGCTSIAAKVNGENALLFECPRTHMPPVYVYRTEGLVRVLSKIDMEFKSPKVADAVHASLFGARKCFEDEGLNGLVADVRGKVVSIHIVRDFSSSGMLHVDQTKLFWFFANIATDLRAIYGLVAGVVTGLPCETIETKLH